KTDTRLSLWKNIDGLGGFTKSGLGKLVLGGNNTYTGDTFVTQGIVGLQGANALGAPTNSEVQSVTVTGTTGTFTLTFKGQTTGPLTLGATALQVQNALQALSTIGTAAGSVSVALSAGIYIVS